MRFPSFSRPAPMLAPAGGGERVSRVSVCTRQRGPAASTIAERARILSLGTLMWVSGISCDASLGIKIKQTNDTWREVSPPARNRLLERAKARNTFENCHSRSEWLWATLRADTGEQRKPAISKDGGQAVHKVPTPLARREDGKHAGTQTTEKDGPAPARSRTRVEAVPTPARKKVEKYRKIHWCAVGDSVLRDL